MGSIFDYSKEVTTTEIVSDHEKEKTENVADNEKKKSETASETKEIVSEKTEKETNEILSEEWTDEIQVKRKSTVFVLGGPGGDKSTQCPNFVTEIGYTNLRSMKSDPENGPMIERMIKEGASVPPGVTMRMLQTAMNESGNDKFLFDEEFCAVFEAATEIEPEVVLLYDCSEEQRQSRILSRNQGRVNDNLEPIRKWFNYSENYTLPVVEYYNSEGKVSKGRVDVNPESIRKRFNYFENYTLPVVEYYNSKGKVSKIDPTKTMGGFWDPEKLIESLMQGTT